MTNDRIRAARGEFDPANDDGPPPVTDLFWAGLTWAAGLLAAFFGLLAFFIAAWRWVS